MESLPHRIAETMRARGLVDADVAALLGVSSTTVHRWRKGRHVPPLERAPELAEFLGVSRDEVLRMMADTERTVPADRDVSGRLDLLEASVLSLMREVAEHSAELARLRAALTA